MIRVYAYGCRAPIAGREEAIRQMKLANRFWNALVEVELRHDAAIEQTLATLAPGSEQAARPVVDEAAIAAWKEKKRQLQSQRAAMPAAEYRAAMSELRARRPRADQEALQAWKARRKEAFAREDIRVRLQELDAERLAAQKRVYAEFSAQGLWWGNSDAVLDSYRRARAQVASLTFHRWQGEGRVVVRYQQGLPVREALAATDSRFQLILQPEATPAWRKRKGGVNALARIRVGSTGKRKEPVWLELPTIIHRPLPEDGVIRQVMAVRSQPHGPHDTWDIRVVVDVPDPVPVASHDRPRVAIDIGWRLREDGGLRVAAWVDSEGRSGELVLPVQWVEGWWKVRNLASIRDQRLNTARTELLEWLKEHDAPAWLQEARTWLVQTRSNGKVASFVRRWADQRFEGDEAIFQTMRAWKNQERHLYEWERHLAQHARQQRMHRYRRFAANLAWTYGEVRIERFDLRAVASRAEKGGTQEDLTPDARWYRVLAACYELRDAIRNACERKGVRVLEREAAWTTQRCHACGRIEPFNAASRREIVHTCAQCGAQWDQDLNAARNLLDDETLDEASQNPPLSEQPEGLRPVGVG